MRLSKRIYKMAEMIAPGETCADIGTDHGYVPMLLVKNGISPRAIMSDISEGSLAKARETFELCGLAAEPADFRTGDGLATVRCAEVDAVIIGGLGGFTIMNILDADIAKSRSFSKLVLQPRKHSGELRHYLYTHGWDIIREELAPEGKFVCEIITAVPAAGADMAYDSFRSLKEAPYPADDIRWKYPEAITAADRELAEKRIGWKIGSIREELVNLRKSGKDHDALISRLESDLVYLTDLVAVR